MKNLDFRVYNKRWLILALFILYSISNLVHFMEYSAINNIIVDYYHTSVDGVTWTTTTGLIIYLIFSIPITHLINLMGCRKSMIIAGIGTCIGSWLKVAAVHPDRLWLFIVGQAVIALFQVVTFTLTPKLACEWFGYNQISTATAIGFIGIQIGSGLSFYIPPLVVANGLTEEVESNLYTLNISYATFATILVPLIYMFFSNAPPTPPSIAQQNLLKSKAIETRSFIKTCHSLLRIKDYMIFLVISGINLAMLTPILLLLNPVALAIYKDAEYDVGVIGLLQTLLGYVGLISASTILDKYKRHEITCWATIFLYLASFGLYTGTLDKGIAFLYVSISLIGFFYGALMITTTEVILELTYPEPESISVGIGLNFMQILSIAFTFIIEYIITNVSVLWANVTMVAILFFADLLLIFLKFNLRKKSVENFKVANVNIKDNNELGIPIPQS